MSKPQCRWFLCLFAVSLPLFFGLFFGLNYKEIIINGWPLTLCTINNATLATRYCCYSDCSNQCRTPADIGSPPCGDMGKKVDNEYSPSECSRNSTLCPAAAGQTCDGGYFCCSECCSTCTSCSTSCSGSGASQSCSQTCTSYSCNCYCCDSTDHRKCTLQCPTCYSVNLAVTYSPYHSNVIQSNVTYSQDFGQDSVKANAFLASHPVDSRTKCYYNPKNLAQVLLDVSFTAWKWAVTALFGMIPLLFALLLSAYFFFYRPLWPLLLKLKDRIIPRFRQSRRNNGKEREVPSEPMVELPAVRPHKEPDPEDSEIPPPYQKDDPKFVAEGSLA
ncbi:hypothetical protein C8J56DRAFT_1030818 [Mycena floridula]|nr:hypothetical protein C8J56DRAFT_1030818 [Mycena floridula]